jgi:NADPH2:quinone reductase
MKAIRIHRHGGPNVLAYEDVVIDQPGAGEIVVRNQAIGVNFVDTYLRSGAFTPPRMPFIPGKEGAARSLRSARASTPLLPVIAWPMSRH